jgi:ketosteroid isomerase-like protein
VSDYAAVLNQVFAEWDRGNFSRGTELYAPDISFSAAQPEGQVSARGPDGVTRFMREFLADWELYRVELHELEEVGAGRFVARATQHATGKGSGVETTAPAFIAIAFRDSEIVQLEFFLERQRALDAFDAVSRDPT